MAKAVPLAAPLAAPASTLLFRKVVEVVVTPLVPSWVPMGKVKSTVLPELRAVMAPRVSSSGSSIMWMIDTSAGTRSPCWPSQVSTGSQVFRNLDLHTHLAREIDIYRMVSTGDRGVFRNRCGARTAENKWQSVPGGDRPFVSGRLAELAVQPKLCRAVSERQGDVKPFVLHQHIVGLIVRHAAAIPQQQISTARIEMQAEPDAILAPDRKKTGIPGGCLDDPEHQFDRHPRAIQILARLDHQVVAVTEIHTGGAKRAGRGRDRGFAGTQFQESGLGPQVLFQNPVTQ